MISLLRRENIMEEKVSGSDDNLYQAIIDSYLVTSSVLKTARTLSVSEVKVRRVLLTEGLWSSRTSLRILRYHNQNMTAAQIAELLHTSEKAVQQYLPYTRGMYHGDLQTVSALNSADYRNRIRVLQEKILQRSRSFKAESWHPPDPPAYGTDEG